jgi:hypothetical protein
MTFCKTFERIKCNRQSINFAVTFEMLSDSQPLKFILQFLRFVGFEPQKLKKWHRNVAIACFVMLELGFITLSSLSLTQTQTMGDIIDGVLYTVASWVLVIKTVLVFVKFGQILGLIENIDKFTEAHKVNGSNKKALILAVSFVVTAVLFFLISSGVSWYQLKLVYPLYEFKTFEGSKIFAVLYVLIGTLAALYTILNMAFSDLLPIVLMTYLPEYFTHLKQMIVVSDLRDKQQIRKIMEIHRELKT